MKLAVLSSAAVLLMINAVAWAVIDGYHGFPAVLVTVSLLITLAFEFSLFAGELADGFRIALSALFGLTGLVRIGLALATQFTAVAEVVYVVYAAVLGVEILAVAWSRYASRHHTAPRRLGD